MDAVLEHVLEHVKGKEMQAVVRFRGSGRDCAMFEETLYATFDEPSYLGWEGAVLIHEPAERGLETALGQEGDPLPDGCHEGGGGAKNHGTEGGWGYMEHLG